MASPDGCVDQDFEGATVLTGTPFALVDAFTTGRAFSGNPAGVLLLDAFPGVEWMQGVANELQQAETAFLAPGEDGEFLLRWFTPVTEVALCGHATLASAHWLWESGVLDREAVAVFATRSGHLTAVRDGHRIVLDFPAVPATQVAPSPQLLAALAGAVPVWAGVTDHADAGERNMLAVLESEQAVRNLAPDLLQITQLPVGGLIITARRSAGGWRDRVATTSADGHLRIWDLRTGPLVCAMRVDGEVGVCRWIDDVTIVTAGGRGLYAFDLLTAQEQPDSPTADPDEP